MNKLKTNSLEVRNQVKQHIIDCVYDEDESTYPDLKQAAKRLFSEFNRVANHTYNIRKFPNEQLRFSDYLSGLPFHFEYEYCVISEYLNSLGINPDNKEYDNDQALKTYHYLIFREMKKAL